MRNSQWDEITSVDDPVDLDAVVAVLLDPKDSDTARHGAANLLRRSNYEGLSADLISIVGNYSNGDRFRAWSVQHLFLNLDNDQSGSLDQDEMVSVFAGLLNDRSVVVRREALLCLSRMNYHATVKTALEWLNHDADGSADLAIRVIRENNAREYVDVVRRFALSDDVPARVAALVTLSDWKDAQSRRAMEVAASLPDIPANRRLRNAGRLALSKLNGEN